MTEQARLELVIDATKAKQGTDQAEKGLTGLLTVSGKVVVSLEGVDKRLDEIGRSSRATATNTENLGRGLSQIALNGQRTAEILSRMETALNRVALNTQRAAAGARAFRAEQTATAASTATLEQRLKLLGDRAGILRSRFTGIFAGLSAAFIGRDLISTLSGFESSLATLRGVTGLERTGQQFQDIEAQARRLGATTRFTAEQAAEGQVFLARAGFDAQQILSALPATLNLAAAGQLDLGQAADLASNAVTQFNLDASETVRVVDSLVNVSNNSNTNIQQLGEALKFAGPIAAGFNISIEDTTAALGKLGDAGIQATLAGTGFRGFLAALATPSSEAEARLGKLGIKLADIDIQSRGLIPVLQTLHDANLDVVDAFDIFDRRNASTALILSRNVEGVKALVEVQEQNANAAQKMADIQDDTLRGSLLALRSALQEAYLSAGDDGLAGGLRSVVDEGTTALRILTGTADEAERADTSAQVLAFTLETVGRSMGAIAAVRLAVYLTNVGRAMAGLNAITAANPWVALATGIGIAAAALISIGNNADEAAERIKRLEDSTVDLSDVLLKLDTERVKAAGLDQEKKTAALVAAELRAVSAARDQLAAEIAKAESGGGRATTSRVRASSILVSDVLRGSPLNPIGSLFEPGEADRIARATIEDLIDSIRTEADRAGSDVTARALSKFLVESGVLDVTNPFKAPSRRFVTGTQARRTEIGAEARGVLLERGLAEAASRGEDITDARVLLREIEAANFDVVNLTTTSVLKLLDAKNSALQSIADAAAGKTQGGASAGAEGLSEFVKATTTELKSQLADLTRGRDLTALEQITAAMKDAEEAARGQKATEEELAAFRAKEFPALTRLAEQIDDLRAKTEAKSKADEEAKRVAESRLEAERGLRDLIEGQRQALFLAKQTDEQRAISVELIKAENLAKEAGRILTISEVARIVGLASALRNVNAERRKSVELAQEGAIFGPENNPDPINLNGFLNAVDQYRDRLRSAREDKAAFFRSFEDDRTFLQAQIDAAAIGRPEQADLVRERILAERELQAILRDTGELETEAGDAAVARLHAEIDAVAALQDELRATEEQRRLFEDVGFSGARALTDFATGARTATEALGGLIEELQRAILAQLVIRPLGNAFASGLGGLFGGSGLIPSANGNVFSGGRVIPFASGGVIDRPILFPLAGGNRGLAGEAGPEAIMPLVRGPGGRLGVQAINSGNSSTVINNIKIGGRRGRSGGRDEFGRSDRQLASDISRRLRAG